MPNPAVLFYPVDNDSYQQSAQTLAKLVTFPGIIAISIFGLFAPILLVILAAGLMLTCLDYCVNGRKLKANTANAISAGNTPASR